jgi:hypothetical protein
LFGAIAKGTNEPFMAMTVLKDITINTLWVWQTTFKHVFQVPHCRPYPRPMKIIGTLRI